VKHVDVNRFHVSSSNLTRSVKRIQKRKGAAKLNQFRFVLDEEKFWDIES